MPNLGSGHPTADLPVGRLGTTIVTAGYCVVRIAADDLEVAEATRARARFMGTTTDVDAIGRAAVTAENATSEIRFRGLVETLIAASGE